MKKNSLAKFIQLSTLGYTSLLTLFSLAPSGESIEIEWDYYLVPSLQNFLHVPAYTFFFLLMVLTLVVMRSPDIHLTDLRQRLETISMRTKISIGLFCAFYGMILELLQQIVPGRSASILDVMANSGGVLFGYLLLAWWQRMV